VTCEERLWNELLETARRNYPNLIAKDFEFPVAGDYRESEKTNVIAVLRTDAFMGARLWLRNYEPANPDDTNSRVSDRAITDRIFKQQPYGAFVPREVLVATAHDLRFPISFDGSDVWIGIKPRSNQSRSGS
jgi:hypothetical protein